MLIRRARIITRIITLAFVSMIIVLLSYHFNNKMSVTKIVFPEYFSPSLPKGYVAPHLQLLNKSANTFSKVITTPRRRRHNPFLLILVTSSPNDNEHYEMRMAIRETWGSVCWNNRPSVTGRKADNKIVKSREKYNCQLIFYTGIPSKRGNYDALKRESESHGDILILNVVDTYFNLVYKLFGALKWIENLQPTFLLKADDDVFVNVNKLMHMLKTDKTLPNDLYGCALNYGPAIRDKSDKYYLSKEEYAEEWYPVFCSGFSYVVSGHLLPRLLNTSRFVSILPFEDVYFGIVMDFMNVTAKRLSSFLVSPKLRFYLNYYLPNSFRRFLAIGDNVKPKDQYVLSKFIKDKAFFKKWSSIPNFMAVFVLLGFCLCLIKQFKRKGI